MLGEDTSWIPVIDIMVLIVGIFRCIDALASKSAQGYLFNMQGGILDIVVGFLVFLSSNDQPNNLNLLVVGYLLTQGIYRNVLLSVEKNSQPYIQQSDRLDFHDTGNTNMDRLTAGGHLVSCICLSTDVCFRGWVLIVMASSLKKDPHHENCFHTLQPLQKIK